MNTFTILSHYREHIAELGVIREQGLSSLHQYCAEVLTARANAQHDLMQVLGFVSLHKEETAQCIALLLSDAENSIK